MDLSRLGSVLNTRWGAATDIGPVRQENEDSWLAAPPLFAVADGMGGHSGGAEASSAALRALAARLSADALGSSRAGLEELASGIEHAAMAVTDLAGTPPHTGSAPGTTLTGVLVLDAETGPYWLTFNIGDSRTYIASPGSILQATKDHSALQEALDAAALTGESFSPPPSNIVTRALGGGGAGLPEADYSLIPLHEGDTVLICTDGVHSAIDGEHLLAILSADADPQRLANTVVDAALDAGSRDNATALVVRAENASRSTESLPVSSRSIRALRPAPIVTARRGVGSKGDE